MNYGAIIDLFPRVFPRQMHQDLTAKLVIASLMYGGLSCET